MKPSIGTELLEDYHRKAREFARTVTDSERGWFGVFGGHHFYKGDLLPDYGELRAVMKNRQRAEEHARLCRISRGTLHVVVQI